MRVRCTHVLHPGTKDLQLLFRGLKDLQLLDELETRQDREPSSERELTQIDPANLESTGSVLVKSVHGVSTDLAAAAFSEAANVIVAAEVSCKVLLQSVAC